MESRWKRLRRALWDPYLNPLLFFAAAYALGISINLTAARLLAWKDPTLPRIFLFGGPALIALAILAPKILRRIFRTEIDPTAQIVEPAQRHKWLVALACVANLFARWNDPLGGIGTGPQARHGRQCRLSG